jgi:transketolase
VRLAFVETLLEVAARDPRVCLLTGDLGFSVLERFERAYPSRFLNVGVAEANMIGLATGLALDGWIPYVYSIATFASMRGYEQLRDGPVLHSLPVRVIGIGGGFAYGHAGITHWALEDFAITRTQPGLAVVAPADPAQTRAALLALHERRGPIYFRIGKGNNPPVPGLEGRFSVDGVETLGSGEDVLLLTTGSIAVEVVEAARLLESDRIRATVAIVAAVNPAPHEALARLVQRFRVVLSVEEHFVQGGLGSLVAEVVAGSGAGARLHRLGVERVDAGRSGSEGFLRHGAGISRASIARRARALVFREQS